MSEPCRKYKSTLVDTVFTVNASSFNSTRGIPIQVSFKAYELSYRPVINYTITVNVPFTHPMDWSDHPFMFSKQDNEEQNKYESANIIDDTPAVRAIIQELAQKEPFKLYTTTDCTHRARLIQALESFWS